VRLAGKYGCLPAEILCVPGSEWGVLPTGLANSERKSAGVDLLTAITCTDRRTQRTRLEPTGLNPKWSVDGTEGLSGFPLVIKAPLSTWSVGVALAANQTDIGNAVKKVSENTAFMKMRLGMVAKADYSCIIEEHVDGQLYEVSGVIDSQDISFYNPLSVNCNEESKEINGFSAMPESLREPAFELARKVARTLGLRWCFFLIEFKLRENSPCVIETQCRLGAAPPYPEYHGLISPGVCPIGKGVDYLLKRWNS